MKTIHDGYMQEWAPLPMVRGLRYSGYYVPMYSFPFRSDDVTALLETGKKVIAAYNHFAKEWVMAETNEIITARVLEWWG